MYTYIKVMSQHVMPEIIDLGLTNASNKQEAVYENIM